MTSKWAKLNGLRQKMFKAQGGKCCYCSVSVIIPTRQGRGKRVATIEHLQRKCEGGKSIPDNLAISCQECNNNRGQVDWLTYKTWHEDK